MDKATPKADLFQANRDRAAPLLKQLRDDHFNQFSSVVGERAAKAYQRSRGEYYQ